MFKQRRGDSTRRTPSGMMCTAPMLPYYMLAASMSLLHPSALRTALNDALGLFDDDYTLSALKRHLYPGEMHPSCLAEKRRARYIPARPRLFSSRRTLAAIISVGDPATDIMYNSYSSKQKRKACGRGGGALDLLCRADILGVMEYCLARQPRRSWAASRSVHPNCAKTSKW